MAKISVVGTGYVGLVTAVGFASKGHQVTCVDLDEAKVNSINQGTPPFFEDGLAELLEHCVASRSLQASCSYQGVANSEIAFVCVGTPSDATGTLDLEQIRNATLCLADILRETNNYISIAIRSTVTPGTIEDVIIPLLQDRSKKEAGKDFGVVANPEFLYQGRAIECFFDPDRIVIGEDDSRPGDFLQSLYSDFKRPVLRTNIKAAEMIKCACNSFLATKISFINEIGLICKKLGIDVYTVADGMGYDPRIGRQFLNAGIGFGGSCLPKDCEALMALAENSGCHVELLPAVNGVNRQQPTRIVRVAEQKIGGLAGKTITVLGLAFKPNTDDIRNSPAVSVVRELLARGAFVSAYDPQAMVRASEALPGDMQFCSSSLEAIQASDTILILTEWDEFKDESLYSGKVVVDGRRALDPARARNYCDYEGLY